MSYESESTLGSGTRINDVREFVGLLGYSRAGAINSPEYGRFEDYWFFDEKDYRSWTGVHLSIQTSGGSILVFTRTPVARSYYDLVHQNFTISSLRKRFGGKFRTDEGGGRYLQPESGPPPAPGSGCHLAFERFGINLIKAAFYLDSRSFPKHPVRGPKDPLVQLGMDPRGLSNNMLVPFLVASLEDYFKSTFIALLRFSPRKEGFFKGVRLQGDQLVSLSDGRATVEEQLVETMPFQNISAVCRHFEALDAKLDIAGTLRKPYRRRRQSLFDLIDSTVKTRHNFIHRVELDASLTDKALYDLVYDLDAAITRVYKRITDHHRWAFDRGWYLGNRRAKGRYEAQAAQPSAAADAPRAARR